MNGINSIRKLKLRTSGGPRLVKDFKGLQLISLFLEKNISMIGKNQNQLTQQIFRLFMRSLLNRQIFNKTDAVKNVKKPRNFLR